MKKKNLKRTQEKIEVLGGDLKSLTKAVKSKKIGVYSKHLFFELSYFSCYFIYLGLAFFMLIIWEPEERSFLIKIVFSFFTMILAVATFIFQQNMDLDIDEDIVTVHPKKEKNKKAS